MVQFNTSLRDSQGMTVQPVDSKKFDLKAYVDYEDRLRESNERFWNSDSGILVYRRVRADGVFYDKCRDYRESLNLQLGGLLASMQYKEDIANFLEPWYGIGYIASAFGGDYKWPKEQAPVVEPRFSSARDILEADVKPIADSAVGKHILEMEEYFLDQTKGLLPISFCDIQSPLNMLSYLLPMTELFMEIYDAPDLVKRAASLCTDLLIEFLEKQRQLLGDTLASPGHGFASSRVFRGVGMSDDNSIMLRMEDYESLFKPYDEKIGVAFGGTVYHSCGNWESHIELVKNMKHIVMVDGAFTAETDPSPNRPEVFASKFENTGIIINARAVGNVDTAYQVFSKLWRPKQRMIAVTYCKSPVQQEQLYGMIHAFDE